MAGFPIELNVPQREAPIGGFGPMPGISAAPIKEAGEAIGRAFGQMGRGLEAGSQAMFGYLEKQAEIENKTRAADFYLRGADAIGQNNAKLLSLSGSEALEYGKKQYFQNNQDIYNGILSQTTNPMQRMMVANELRRTMAANDEMAYRHLANQEKTYQKTTAELNQAKHGNDSINYIINGNIPASLDSIDSSFQEAVNEAFSQGIYGDQAETYARAKTGLYAVNAVKGAYFHPPPGQSAIDAADQYFQKIRPRIDEKATAEIDTWLKAAHSDAEAEQFFKDIKGLIAPQVRDLGAGAASAGAAARRSFREKYGFDPPNITPLPPGVRTRGLIRGASPANETVTSRDFVGRTELAGTTTPPTVGFSPYLERQRARMTDEVARDPELALRVAAVGRSENAADPIAPIESLYNRAEFTGQSLASLITRDFYGSIRDGGFQKALRELRADPAEFARYRRLTAEVGHGSNVLGGATDQGSPTDPNAGHSGGRVIREREVYNDWAGHGGHEAARRFREAQQAEVHRELAARRTATITNPTTGERMQLNAAGTDWEPAR